MAGIGLVIAVLRRDWRVLVIAGCSALWLVIEIAFALHGFPGVPRYMFEAAATMIVVAGVGVGWVLSKPPRVTTRAARVAGGLVVVAVVALMVPRAVTAARTEHKDLLHERARTAEIQRLDAAIKAFGGYKFIRSCGDPASDVEYVSILAWYTKLDVGFVGHRPLYIAHVETQPLGPVHRARQRLDPAHLPPGRQRAGGLRAAQQRLLHRHAAAIRAATSVTRPNGS